MTYQIHLANDSIDQQALIRQRTPDSGIGAVLEFSGIVRGTEENQAIAAIEYEAFERMVKHQFDLLFGQIEKQWPIHSIRLVHRIGKVPVGETSLWVEITSPHRAEAFAACQYLIDEMKRVVPIWKKPVK